MEQIAEFLKPLVAAAPLFTAGAAVTGAVVAVLGYRKWHTEAVGKRKIELAEDTLAGFYEARRLIQAARSPLAIGTEGSTFRDESTSSESIKRLRRGYFVPVERLQKFAEKFSALEAKRYRCKALFGPEVDDPFEIVSHVYNQIVVASQMLIETSPRYEGELPSDPELMATWRRTIWATSAQDDHIGSELDRMVELAEKLLRPILSKSGPI